MDVPTMVLRQVDPETTDLPPGFEEENGRIIPFWYTRTGVIVKWSVFLGLLVIFTVYTVVGYTHAKRRIRKGLPPLAYHRWLVSRAELARVDPRYAYPQSAYTTYRPEYYAQYRMQTDMPPPPPPMYDPSGRPPTYSAPVGGTKTAPSQWTQAPSHRPAHEEYGAAPPGPPPAHTAAAPVAPEHTGSTNPYRS